MNRITQLFVVVLGTIVIGFTANAQLTVTGGDLVVPDDRVGIGTATPETLLHVEGVNNTLILARGNTQGNSVLIQARNMSSGDAGIMVRNGSGFWSAGIDGTNWTIRDTSDLQDGPKSELRIKPTVDSTDSMMVYARSYNSDRAGFVATGTGSAFAFGTDNGQFAIKDNSDLKDGAGSELRMKAGGGGTDGIAVTARSHTSRMAAYVVHGTDGYWASGVDGTNYRIKNTSDIKDGASNELTIKPSTGAGDSIGVTARSSNSDMAAFIVRGTGGYWAAGIDGNSYQIKDVSDLKDGANNQLVIKPSTGGSDSMMVTARSLNSNQAGFVARGTGQSFAFGNDNGTFVIKDTSDIMDGPGNALSIKRSVSSNDSIGVTARAHGGSSAGFVVRSTAGNWVTGIKADGNFHIANGNDIKDGGIEKMTVTTNGRVGIGTNNPGAELDVVGEVRSSLDGYFGHFQLRNSGNRAMIQNNSGSNLVEINDNFRVDGTLRIGGGASAASDALQIDNGSIRLSDSYQIQWGNSLTQIKGSNNNFLRFFTNSNTDPRMVIQGSLVGIGTTDPTSHLDVDGEARIRQLPADDSLDSIVVADANGVLHSRTLASVAAMGAQGPQGEPGAAGAQGAQGKQGPAGQDASSDCVACSEVETVAFEAVCEIFEGDVTNFTEITNCVTVIANLILINADVCAPNETDCLAAILGNVQDLIDSKTP
jgi:hypothetical protein